MRPGKTAIFDEVRRNLESAGFAILADYRGMTVEQMSELRSRVRAWNGKVQVVKNSTFSRVAADLGRSVGDGCLSGPTLMVVGRCDAVTAAKTLRDFVKEVGLPSIKGGMLGAQALSREDVNALAEMPSRETMLGLLVGTVAAPMTQLVGVLNRKTLSLLYVLQAVADKKSGENG